MMRGYRRLAPFLILLSVSIEAAVITDGRMGATQTLAGPEYRIDAALGQQVGENLFHSFNQFSLSADEAAWFSGAANISRIISQVTGGNASFIDGLIGSEIVGADLYLLNPAGMVFGENVALDISGSFYASTADTLKFADGKSLDFNSDKSQLTSAAPSAFGFVKTATDLSVKGSFLEVPVGESLFLAGANLNLSAQNLSPELSAKSGGIKLVASAIGDEISASIDNLETHLKGSDLTIGDSLLDADGSTTRTGGGAINLQGQNVQIDNSSIRSRSLFNDDGQAIQIQADNIVLSGGSSISTSTLFGAGTAGNISLQAKQNLTLLGLNEQGIATTIRSNVGAQTLKSASGNGGTIHLQATDILFKEGASVGSNSYALGDGGTVELQANNSIIFRGVDSNDFSSGVYSASIGSGKAGDIAIKAPEVSLENGAIVTAENVSKGAGGTVNIEANNLKLTGLTASGYGSLISANTQSPLNDAGEGGQISLKTQSINLENGGQISTSSQGAGNAGNIQIDTNSLSATGSDLNGFYSGVYASAEGNGLGGQIRINADRIILQDAAQINSATFAGGAGGLIEINSGSLSLDNQALVTAISEEGSGVAGDINLNMSGATRLSGNAAIETRANGADGGSIHVNSTGYIYLDDSSLTTSVLDAQGNSGNGGNIDLNPRFVVQSNSPIIARAQRGNGGNILINTTGIYPFFPILNNPIDASSEFGVDGVVTISSPTTNVVDALLAMPTDFLQEKIVLANSCAVNDGNSSFIEKPRLGVPSQNDDWLSDRLILPMGNK